MCELERTEPTVVRFQPLLAIIHLHIYMHLLYARFMETNHELERKIWKGSVFELAATSTSNICIFSFYFRERKMLYITTLENNV